MFHPLTLLVAPDIFGVVASLANTVFAGPSLGDTALGTKYRGIHVFGENLCGGYIPLQSVTWLHSLHLRWYLLLDTI